MIIIGLKGIKLGNLKGQMLDPSSFAKAPLLGSLKEEEIDCLQLTVSRVAHVCPSEMTGRPQLVGCQIFASGLLSQRLFWAANFPWDKDGLWLWQQKVQRWSNFGVCHCCLQVKNSARAASTLTSMGTSGHSEVFGSWFVVSGQESCEKHINLEFCLCWKIKEEKQLQKNITSNDPHHDISCFWI